MKKWEHIGLLGDFGECEDGLIQAINKNFALLDKVVQLSVIDFVDTLPEDPEENDTYILEDDVYSGGPGTIYYFANGDWRVIEPKEGWQAYVLSRHETYRFNGISWSAESSGGGLNILGGGELYWDNQPTDPSLSFDADMKIVLPGLEGDDNLIEVPAQPIPVEDGEFLFVIPNNSPGGSPLVIQAGDPPISPWALILGFRDGDDLVFAGHRLQLGESATLYRAVETGGGEGGINYIKNGNAEQIINPWLSYSDGTPYPITGGTSTGSDVMTRSNTDPIRGTHSWVTDDISVGNGYRLDFEIDEADVGRSLTVSLDAQFLSAPIPELYSVWIYDVAESALCPLRGPNPNSGSYGGGTGQNIFESTSIRNLEFRFTASAGRQYRLLLHKGEIGSGAIRIDSIRVGPTEVTAKAVDTDNIIPYETSVAENGNGDASLGGWTAVQGFFATADWDIESSDDSPLWRDHSFLVKKGTGSGTGSFFLSRPIKVPDGLRNIDSLQFRMLYDFTDSDYPSGDLKLEFWNAVDPDDSGTWVKLTDVTGAVEIPKGKGQLLSVLRGISGVGHIVINLVLETDNATSSAWEGKFSKVELTRLGTLMAGPVSKQAVIDLTGSGDFTSGSIRVSRSGGVVSISGLGTNTFTSTKSTQSTADGAIPEWARPPINSARTVSYRYDSPDRSIIIEVTASGRLNVIWTTGTSANSIGNVIFISYAVEDDTTNIFDAAELELLAGSMNVPGKDGSQTITSGNSAIVKFRTTEANYFNDVGDFDGEYLTVKQQGELVVYTTVIGLKNGGYGVLSIGRERDSSASFFGASDFPGTNLSQPTSCFAIIPVEPGDKIFVNARNQNGASDWILSNTNSRSNLSAFWKFPLKVAVALAGGNKFIVKTLSGNVTSDGAIADLAVSGLTIGKTYIVGGHIDFRVSQGGTDNNVSCSIACGTDLQTVNTNIGGGIAAIMIQAVSFKFTAKATSISFTASSATANSFISENATRITITECNNEKEVSSF